LKQGIIVKYVSSANTHDMFNSSRECIRSKLENLKAIPLWAKHHIVDTIFDEFKL
jgi:hypothetical protein